MKRFKRIAAAVLAAALAATLCGCDRGYLMTVDGIEIRNGIYITYLQSAYGMAQEELTKQNTTSDTSSESDASSGGDTSTSSLPITEETISGKNGSQWIKDEALKAVRRFVAVQRKSEELGISLTDEEINTITSELHETWNNENQYVQYMFGYSTMGEYYESQGVAEESMREIQKVNKLQEKLFDHYYKKGGELEVKDSEIDEYLTENYASVKSLPFGYTDASGKALESDEDKKAVKDKAQKYADRINNGEKPADVFYDYYMTTAEENFTAKAETEYKEDNEEGLSKEEWIKKQIEAQNIKKAESEDDLLTVIKKDSTTFDTKTTEYIMSAPADNKATLFEADNSVYLIIKNDVTENTKWKEDNNDKILSEMKTDDFRSLFDLYGQNYEVELDESLVNNKYSPEKLNASK